MAQPNKLISTHLPEQYSIILKCFSFSTKFVKIFLHCVHGRIQFLSSLTSYLQYLLHEIKTNVVLTFFTHSTHLEHISYLVIKINNTLLCTEILRKSYKQQSHGYF